MTAIKQSSKCIVHHSNPAKGAFTIFRDPGAKNNPNSWSLIGADGADVAGVVKDVEAKIGLITTADEWEKIGEAHTPPVNGVNEEINHVWRLKRPVDELAFRPNHMAGLSCFKLSHFVRLRADYPALISPALAAVMDACPQLFVDGEPTS